MRRALARNNVLRALTSKQWARALMRSIKVLFPSTTKTLISLSLSLSLFSVFPHGLWMTLFASLMAIVSWAFSVGVHATCFFVQGNDEKQTGFGIWTMENVIPTPTNDYQCVEYTFVQTHLMDRKWNSAAGMAYSAGLIGFIFGVFLVGSSCAAYSRAFFKLAGVNTLWRESWTFVP